MASIMDRMKKASFIERSAVLSKSQLFKNDEFVPLPVPMMNVAFSGKLDGGFSNGLIQLAGPSKHFKSNMALVLCKAYLDKYPDSIIMFFDSEFGSSEGYFKAAGIDPDRVFHVPFINLEELKLDLIKKLEALESGDRVLFFIDSIGNSASKKELEDALNEKSVGDMTRAKQIKSIFRMATPYLTIKKVPLIAINHTYQTQEMYSKTVVSGGCLEEGAHIIMADGSVREIQNVQVGEYVKTLLGPREVTHVWNPETLTNGEPECIEVEMDDGHTVTCSYNHQFLVETGQGQVWVQACDLEEGMEIVSV